MGSFEKPFSWQQKISEKSELFFCKKCDKKIFHVDDRVEKDFPWLVFCRALDSDFLNISEDFSLGVKRQCIACATCFCHLGFLCNDRSDNQMRYVINSCSVRANK